MTDEQIKAFFPTNDGFNYAPVGFHEVTEKEFAQSGFFTYPFEANEYRQLLYDQNGKPLTKDTPILSIRLFFHSDNQGFGMSTDYWAGKVRYFRFGCEHEYEHTKKLGNCYNQYTCKVCGHVNAVDSSD